MLPEGIEPTLGELWVRCIHQIAKGATRMIRLELMTDCLEGSCSIQLSYIRFIIVVIKEVYDYGLKRIEREI